MKTVKRKFVKQVIRKTHRGKRNCATVATKSLVFAGVNPAGARAKWNTWRKVIRQAEASVWTMQETQCTQINSLKMDDLDFIVYEKVRNTKIGGGVAIAAKKDLNPVLISEGDDDVEAITIDIHPKNIVISCTSAYGPQQRDTIEKKTKFWEFLDKMADNSWDSGKGFYLQGDLNAWLGDGLIPGDPHKQNENGKLFHNFLLRHPQLSVANALPICNGIITRKRSLNSGKIEESVLDIIVICSRVLPYFTEMVIDVDNKYVTTNYTAFKKKLNAKAVNSDHRTVFAKMNLKTAPFRISRREIYNLKNIQCQNTFKSATDKSYDLRACMKLMLPLSERADAWKTSLKSHISRSFKKIRVRKSQVKTSSSDYLIDKRNKLTKLNEKEHSVLKKQTITTQIANIEIQIAQIILKEGLEKAYKFRKFCNASSSFPVQEMWKFKNKLWPKKHLPFL